MLTRSKPRHAYRRSKYAAIIAVLTALALSGCGSGTEKTQAPVLKDTADTRQSQTPPQQLKAPETSQHTKPDRPLISPKKIAEANAATTMVFTSSDAKQCEFDGHPPSKTASTLKHAKVRVLRSHCGQRTGVMVAAMCGRGTTNINLHEIHSEDLPQAINIGYRPVSELMQGKQLGYQIVTCKTHDS